MNCQILTDNVPASLLSVHPQGYFWISYCSCECLILAIIVWHLFQGYKSEAAAHPCHLVSLLLMHPASQYACTILYYATNLLACADLMPSARGYSQRPLMGAVLGGQSGQSSSSLVMTAVRSCWLCSSSAPSMISSRYTVVLQLCCLQQQQQACYALASPAQPVNSSSVSGCHTTYCLRDSPDSSRRTKQI